MRYNIFYLLPAILAVNAQSQCDFAVSNGFPWTNTECRLLCDQIATTPGASRSFSEVCHFQAYEVGATELILIDDTCYTKYVIGMADPARPHLSGFAAHWADGPTHCQGLCQAEQRCVYFVWLYQGLGGMCFLKDAEQVDNDQMQGFYDYNDLAIAGPAFCGATKRLHGRDIGSWTGRINWSQPLYGSELRSVKKDDTLHNEDFKEDYSIDETYQPLANVVAEESYDIDDISRNLGAI